MKVRLSLIAREVIIAADSGVPSAINIVEGIQVEAFPLFLANLSYLSIWAKDNNDQNEQVGTLRVLIDETEIISNSVNFVFASNKNVLRHVAQIQGLIIEKPSRLTFKIEVGDQVSQYTIDVVGRPQISAPQEKTV